MAQPEHELYWPDIAFGDKRALRDLRAVFIAAPRDISAARLKQLIKEYLPKGHLVLGIATEPYVLGFEDQPQFTTLQVNSVLSALIQKINAISPRHTVTVLHYAQRDTPFVLEAGKFSRVLFINGSWQHAFHHRPEFYVLTRRRMPFELLPAFVDEAEAKRYLQAVQPMLGNHPGAVPALSATEMMAIAESAARRSFDYTFQMGAALARINEDGMYTYLLAAHNTVVPYETYALLQGSTRERHFSPLNDLNYYDTIHAEIMTLLEAMGQGIALQGTALFVNLLPCPTCARILAATPIAEFIYARDHSNGYAGALLERSGKKVRRLVRAESED